MRRLLALLLLLPASPSFNSALAQNPAPLSSIRQVVALTNAQAARSRPVRLEATVTYAELQDNSLFIQDDGLGVYVSLSGDPGLTPGDRVLVTGLTEASFRPEINAKDVRLLSHGSLPAPREASFPDLIQSKFDSQYVTIRGRVLAAALDQEQPQQGMRLQVQVSQGQVQCRISQPGKLRPEDLLDTEVQLTGVAGGAFDSKMQMSGVWLDMNTWKDVQIIAQPKVDPWSLPLIPMDDVVYAYRDSNQSSRVRIAGTLTYFEPGALAVVEEQGRSMLVETDSNLPLHAGISVEATGFPSVAEQSVRLQDGQLRPVPQAAQVQPLIGNWEDASAGKYAYDLVAMEGEVVSMVHDSRVDQFILNSRGHLFSATLRHDSSDAARQVSAYEPPSVGSHVRVTGVCFLDSGNHWRDRLWFSLRMRSLEDVVVLQQPSWWTVKNMAYIVTAMSVLILIAIIWAGLLDRRLRRQTAVLARQSQEDAIRERNLARQEQQRSRILELISSSAPLPDVLRDIQNMVSSRLYGASCWFELHPTDGSRSDVTRPDGPGVVFQEMFSRDGNSLGLLLATPLLRRSAGDDISAALVAGARLAELAIETRRLYSDLHRRSEYDLLTDIPNRFSMEKTIDQLMLSARRSEAVFGLIYVDLDRFKQVNDRHGHRIGDLYLQEATRRMKLQLRNEDVLARIGGDEFIALVPILRNRVDAEEIAIRLERCFDEPFELEELIVHGSASVGLAVFPEDGSNKEDLQRAADAAMYAHKQQHKKMEQEVSAGRGLR